MTERTGEGTIELSAELVVQEVSASALALYGLREAAVKGRALGDVLASDSGPIDWAAHWTAVQAGDLFEQMMVHEARGGHRLWVRCRLTAQVCGARLWVRRASGREVQQQQPGGLVGAIGQMLATGGVGLWMADSLIEEFGWSDLARALHDLPAGVEPYPDVLFGQMHADDRAQAAMDIQRGFAERTPYDGVVRVKHGEHGYRHLHVFGGMQHDSTGQGLLALGGVCDVSEQVALRRRADELEEQLRATQRGAVLGRLARGIAHDFNNILTGILGCCELLELGELLESERCDVERIRLATSHGANLTRQLLALGRRQALQCQPVAPGAVLAQALGLLHRALPDGVELRLLPDEARGLLWVDVTQLHQVLVNLIVNAAQAMPSGGRIEISTAQVSWSPSEAAGQPPETFICFAVEDTGPGVAPELRERIFEPFFSTKPPARGSGLGLSVVQGIVEQHQGHVLVKDGTLGGARFEVYLPVADPSCAMASDAPPVGASIAIGAGRVLLVEDDPMVRELTQRLLSRAGLDVIEAADAEAALKCAADKTFDVLLTDVLLPGMSGPALVARLRELGSTFRVVYMSGYAADFVESRLPLGADELLVHKPFTAATLLEALRLAGN